MQAKILDRNGYTYQLTEIQCDVDFTETAPYTLRVPKGKTRIISRFPLRVRVPGGIEINRIRDITLDIDHPGSPILIYEAEGTILREFVSVISWDPSGHPGPAMPDGPFLSGVIYGTVTWTAAADHITIPIEPPEIQFFKSIFIDKIVAWRLAANSLITGAPTDEIRYVEICDGTPTPVLTVPNELDPASKGIYLTRHQPHTLLIPCDVDSADNFKFYGMTNVAATYLFVWVHYRGL